MMSPERTIFAELSAEGQLTRPFSHVIVLENGFKFVGDVSERLICAGLVQS